jgi:hypothetical protein
VQRTTARTSRRTARYRRCGGSGDTRLGAPAYDASHGQQRLTREMRQPLRRERGQAEAAARAEAMDDNVDERSVDLGAAVRREQRTQRRTGRARCDLMEDGRRLASRHADSDRMRRAGRCESALTQQYS